MSPPPTGATGDPYFDLSGKTAVVTGGSRGLGRQMCEAFAAHGADVVVASRKQEACDSLADHLTAAHGVEAIGLATHVGRWVDCDRLAETAYNRFGQVDILVNNAGMSPRYDDLLDVGQELFEKVVAVNLEGPFRLASLIGSRMRESGGSIINVSSITAANPDPDALAYSAAKAGLEALTRGLAKALAPHVRVNAIRPGSFLTDISAAWDMDSFEKTARAEIPLGRGGQPEEIVGAALYLAGAASSYTTGTVLAVDGGWGTRVG